MEPLTDQQRKVLAVVEDRLRRQGYPPTLREIGRALDLANVNAVRGHLEALERKGYITRQPDKARSIRVVRSPSAFSRLKRRLHEVFRTDRGVLHRLVYGLAWTVAGGGAIPPALRQVLAEALQREALEHGWRLLRIDIHPDRVAVVVQVWPNHSPEQTVGRLRAAGERALACRVEGGRGGRRWAEGYVATTDPAMLDGLLARLLGEPPGPDG